MKTRGATFMRALYISSKFEALKANRGFIFLNLLKNELIDYLAEFISFSAPKIAFLMKIHDAFSN